MVATPAAARAEQYTPRYDRIRSGLARTEPRSPLAATSTPRLTRQDSPRATIKKDRDSVWNGLLIGFAAGVVTGVIITRTECGDDRECRVNGGLVVIPISAAIGAATGAILDAFTH